MSHYDDIWFDGTFWNFILLLGGVFAAGVLTVIAFFLLRELRRAACKVSVMIIMLRAASDSVGCGSRFPKWIPEIREVAKSVFRRPVRPRPSATARRCRSMRRRD